MAYELWEQHGGNIIADFPSREKALEAVRLELLSNSKADLRTWLLLYEDQDGETVDLAVGAALLEMAMATTP
jgi:hypothetical protein